MRKKKMLTPHTPAFPVISDGGMYLASPVDPVMVLLPVLDAARDKVRPAATMATVQACWLAAGLFCVAVLAALEPSLSRPSLRG